MANEDDFGIIGVTLANAFHVERVVAHGGFAIVYRGIHGGFRAPIALKCLRIPEGMTEAQRTTFLERFREEGELLFRLSAAIPEIVRPLHIDAVILPSGALMPFLALEWLEGEGFDQVLVRNQRERKAGMDLLTLVDLLRPVAHALSRAHNFPVERDRVCVVHRDLKPENLFLCNVAGAPSIKILDYGIAEVCSVAQRVSGAGAWRGMNPFTPGYGAPEQWAPDRFGTSGPWTDVWGLALTMTEALAGRPAIDGDVDAMRRAALDPRRRPTPRSLGNIVSNDVERIFARALALDPRDRTQDIETFWTELEVAAGLGPSMQQRPGIPAPRASQRRAQVMELADAPFAAEIDLDLSTAPESLRARAKMASIPPVARVVEEAVEEELPSIDEAPTSHSGPISGPISSPRSGPQARGSGPRSHDPDLAPASTRSDYPPASVRQRVSSADIGPPSVRTLPSFDGVAGAPKPQRAPHASSPASVRPGGTTSGSMRPGAGSIPPARAPLDSLADSPLAKAIAAVKGRFALPAGLLVGAILITVLDLISVRAWGGPLALGPVRSFWVAGPLALAGAGLLVWKLLSEEDDD